MIPRPEFTRAIDLWPVAGTLEHWRQRGPARSEPGHGARRAAAGVLAGRVYN